jgi:hypothetical protein
MEDSNDLQLSLRQQDNNPYAFHVASSLKEKVLLELEDEEAKLQEELSFFRSIKVISESQTRILAEATLDDEGYEERNGIDRWRVNFFKPNHKIVDMSPIRDLRYAELQVGGVIHLHLTQSEYQAYAEAYDADSMSIEVRSYYAYHEIVFLVSPVDSEFFHALRAIDPEQLLDKMIQVLSLRTPVVTVEFKRVLFSTSSSPM